MRKRLFIFLLFFLVLIPKLADTADVILSWDRSPDPVDGYKIFYAEESVLLYPTYNYVDIGDGDTTECTIPGFLPGTTYYFALKAYNGYGMSGWSNEVTWTPPDPDEFNKTLIIVKGGTGTGTITSSPAGIDCGTTCSASFSDGRVLTLTPTPASGSTFTGWSGGTCSGTGSCLFTLNSDVTISASFSAPTTTSVPTTTTSVVTTTSIASSTTTTVSANILYATDFATVDGWDNKVLFVGGSNQIVVSTDKAYSGSTSLKLSGGTYQSGRKTVTGLTVGDTVKFSGWIFSSSANQVYFRLHGLNQTNWVKSSVVSGGTWKYFEIQKTLTAVDVNLDLDVYSLAGSDVIYVDSVKLEKMNASSSTTTLVSTTSSSSVPTTTTSVTTTSSSVIPTTTTSVTTTSSSSIPTTTTSVPTTTTSVVTTTSIASSTTTTVSANILYATDFATVDGWDNKVLFVGGSNQIVVSTDKAYSGSTSLKLSGGTYQSGRKTVTGLTVGDTVKFSGWIFSSSANQVYFRLHGLNQTNWVKSSVVSGGTWKYFEIQKTLTAVDVNLDLDVYSLAGSDVIYVDSVKLEKMN